MAKDFGTTYPERKYFERGLNLLIDGIENDRVRVTSNKHLVDSLTRLKKLPNGRINLLTVDELVRCSFLILASGQMDKYYECKK